MADRNAEKKSRTGIDLFRIAGIQISVDFSWFIIFALIVWSLSAGYFPREFPGQSPGTYWLAGSIASLFFFVSVLLHELSHSLMAIRSGIKIPEITLFIFGGVSRLSEEAKDPGMELKIAAVGPLSSFVLAGLFRMLEMALHPSGPAMLTAIAGYLAWINLVLGVFNLVPGFPLDGGRILRAFLWWRTGSLARATKWASDVGKGFAVAMMILGAFQIFSGMLIGGMWMVFIGIFLRGIAEGGYQEVVMRQALEGVKIREVMVEDVVTVAPQLSISRLINDYFLRFGYKGFPVVRDGRIVGMVSLTEIKNIPEDEQPLRTVEEVMVPLSEEMRIEPELSLAEALKRMGQEDNTARLVVMDKDRMVGLITSTGLLRFVELKRILHR